MAMETTAVDWDALADLLRWKHRKNVLENAAQMMETCSLVLLRPLASSESSSEAHNEPPKLSITPAPADATTMDQEALQLPMLAMIQQRFNVPKEWILKEILSFLLLVLTKSHKNSASCEVQTNPKQPDHDDKLKQLFHLLHISLRVHHQKSILHEVMIPASTCNLILDGIATLTESQPLVKHETLEEAQWFEDACALFLYLFGMELQVTEANQFHLLQEPRFGMFKPQPNQYLSFMQRCLPILLAHLLQKQAKKCEMQAKVVQQIKCFVFGIFEVFHALQRGQLNKKKVFLVIAKSHLRSFLTFHEAVHRLCHPNTKAEQRHVDPLLLAIEKSLNRIMLEALFDKEHFAEFEQALVHGNMWLQHQNEDGTKQKQDGEGAPPSKKKRKHQQQRKNAESNKLVSFQRQLFEELVVFLSCSETSWEQKKNVGEVFKLMVRFYASEIRQSEDPSQPHSSFKGRKRTATSHVLAGTGNGTSPFRFWAECCAVVMLAFDRMQWTYPKSQNELLAMVICLFDALFEALAVEDVYRITEDDANQSHFQQLEAVWKRLLHLLHTHGGGCSPPDACNDCIIRCQASILRNATVCSPKLVQVDLKVTLAILARETFHSSRDASTSATLSAIASGFVCIVKAFESMRLLDTLLKSLFTTPSDDQTSRGLLMLLTGDSSCERAWRKCFGSMLSISSIELIWTLFLEQIAGFTQIQSASNGTTHLTLVRLLFGLFLEEIQVNSSNREKIQHWVVKTFEELFGMSAPLSDSGTCATTCWLSTSENTFEMWNLYGQMLLFYHEVDSSTRVEVFDAFLDSKSREVAHTKLSGKQDESVQWKTILETGSRRFQGFAREDLQSRQTALVCNGVLQLLLHLVRLKSKTEHQVEVATCLASAVCEFVVDHRAWRLIAFRLPDLVECLTSAQCVDLLFAFWSNTIVSSESNEALDAIVNDAAFYELSPFQQAAPKVLAKLAWQNLLDAMCGTQAPSKSSSKWLTTLTTQIKSKCKDAEEDTLTTIEWCTLLQSIQKDAALAVKLDTKHEAIYEFVRSFPLGFLQHDSMDTILRIAMCHQALSLRCEDQVSSTSGLYGFIEHGFMSMVPKIGSSEDPFWSKWLAIYMDHLIHVTSVPDYRNNQRTKTTLMTAKKCCLCRVLRVVLYHMEPGKLLSQVAQQQLAKLSKSFGEKPDDWFDSVVFWWSVLLESISSKTGSNVNPVAGFVQGFVQQTLQVALQRGLLQPECINGQSLEIATALLRMMVHLDGISDEDKLDQGLRHQLIESLVFSMQTLCDPARRGACTFAASWEFFLAFCTSGLGRPELSALLDEGSNPKSTLKTFGRLVAAAFVAMSYHPEERDKAEQAIQALVTHASRRQVEFELLLHTIITEIKSSERRRVATALVALRMVFARADRRQMALSRREILSNAKHQVVAALCEVLRNLVIQEELADQASPSASLPVCSLIMENLEFCFCKPEVFSWKSHDLALIFTCLEPLQVIAADAKWANKTVLSCHEVDRIWCCSYSLLLRVVRHLFQPLGLASNGSSVFFIVNGCNALLQVLLLWSNSQQEDKVVEEAVDDDTKTMLLTWSSNLARLFGYLKEHNVTFRKHVVYLVIQFVVAATKGDLSLELQQRLRPGVFALLDICSDHERDQLFACLDSTGRTFLKSLDTTYKLTHRFVGKV